MKSSMKKKWLQLFFLYLVISLPITSCSAPTPLPPEENPILQTAVALSVAGTQSAETITAVVPTLTFMAASPTPSPRTPTPTRTPAPTLTPTVGGVWLTVKEESYCRTGPASTYEMRVLLPPGTLVEAMARNEENDYYYIRNPQNLSDYCWVWDKYTTVKGSSSSLPVFTPQPSPTPRVWPTPTTGQIDFSVRYSRLVNCNNNYGIVLYVENTGSLILRSIRVNLTDSTINKNYYHESDIFRGTTTDPCVLDLSNSQEDLIIGEGSEVACVNPGQFGYDPTGHEFNVKITLFIEDGRKGTSVVKTITFTP